MLVDMALDEVTLDKRFQARQAIDLDTVKEYAELYLSGTAFPPLAGINVGDAVYLIEGWHRYNALKRIGRETCDIVIERGTVAKAKALAASSNKTHGLRRKKEDTQIILRLAFESIAEMGEGEWESWKAEKGSRTAQATDGWSSGDIVLMTGFVGSTVWKYRAAIFEDLSVERSSILQRREAKVAETHRETFQLPNSDLRESVYTMGALPPLRLLRVVDEATGEILGTVEDSAEREAVADQAHEIVKAIVSEAFKTRSRGQEVSEAEHRAAIRTTRVDQTRSAVRDLLAIGPQEMAEDWALDKRKGDLSELLGELALQLTDYAAAVGASVPQRLRAVK